jgi:hypothetical protein
MSYRDDNTTPSLEQVIKNAIEGRLNEVHTALPAQVLSYDPSNQTCSVQPSIQRKYSDGTLVKIPVINMVPVVHPRTADAFVHLPIAPGDLVLLVFIERSIDIWKTTGGTPDPMDARKHHYSDAVAIPGLYPKGQPFTVSDPSVLTVQKGTSTFEVGASGFKFKAPGLEADFNQSGTIKIQNKNDGVELMDLLTRLVQAIITARTETLIGPQPLINLVGGEEFETLYTLLSKLKG